MEGIIRLPHEKITMGRQKDISGEEQRFSLIAHLPSEITHLCHLSC